MSDQLVLTGDALLLAVALVPCSPISGELLKVLDDPTATASLAPAEVRQISRALDAAQRSELTVTRAAVRNAGDELRQAMGHIDLEALVRHGRQTVPVVLADRACMPIVPAALEGR